MPLTAEFPAVSLSTLSTIVLLPRILMSFLGVDSFGLQVDVLQSQPIVGVTQGISELKEIGCQDICVSLVVNPVNRLSFYIFMSME
jgi:hypothetical protein